MLKSLLTPLRTRFEEAVSLRNDPPESVPESPEDFERDARIETMRMVVHSINAVEDDTARIDLLGEASRLMELDPMTKDVFREMDGFLILISVLSTGAFSVTERPAAMFEKGIQVFSVAMIDHPMNQNHFKYNVGYDALESSVADYLNRPEQGTKSTVLSSLAGFTFQLPSLATFLPTIDSRPSDDPDATAAFIDNYTTQLDTPSARITHPLAIPILLRLTWSLHNDTYTYAITRLFDRLATVSYANRAAMAASGVVRLVWDRLYPTLVLKSEAEAPGAERISTSESHALQKLLRRITDVGAPLFDLKYLFKCTSNTGTIGLKALSSLKGNPHARWPSFLAFRGEGSGLDVKNVNLRGKGISVLLWVYIEHRSSLPVQLFGLLSSDSRAGQHTIFALVLKPDGGLSIQPTFRKSPDSVDLQGPVPLPGSMVQRGRWTHLGLTWAPGEAGLRVYIDGHHTDTLFTIAYPRFSQADVYYGSSPLEKVISNSNAQFDHPPMPRPTPQHTHSYSSYTSQSSLPAINPPSPQFYLSSTHLLNTPISPVVVRLIHHLGPRYAGTLRTGLGRYLTYEAATALNVHLFASAGNANTSTDLAAGLETGLEESVVCVLLPFGWVEGPVRAVDEEEEVDAPRPGERRILNCVAEKEQRAAGWANVRGDVQRYEIVGTDEALRRVGGAAVGLGFVQRAETSEQLHESICVLLNAVQTNWRVLEDMESLSGYEVLAQLLYEKAGLVSLDIFHSLFEFLGIDFKTPSKSVVTNPQSYRALALDIDLWARTHPSVQSAYFDHFSTLLATSKFARFTVKSKLTKVPMLKKLLLAVQLSVFKDEMEARLVGALRVVAQAMWTSDTIKAIVAYLAANLHTTQDGTASITPTSTISSLPTQTDKSATAQRAELVLDALVTILHSPTHLQRFTAALPASRILLLLLGEHPTPVVAAHILTLLGLMMNSSPSFGRKFELAHGWTVVRCIVPGAWDPCVHVAAFDLLFGRVGNNRGPGGEGQVVNPVVFPMTLTALQRGLQREASGHSDAVMDALVGEMVELYGSVPTFRLLFKTKSTMAIFIDLFRDFLKLRREEGGEEGSGARLEEKLRVLAGLLSENPVVDAGQRQELRDIAAGTQTTNASRRQSARMSLNTLGSGEPTYVKTMIRLAAWRKSTATAERQRLRKMIQDRREARRQVSNLQEWKRRIESDSELFPGSKREIRWQLDDTEGPFRVRKKLQMEHGRLGREADDDLPHFSREVHETEDDSSSVVHIEVPPWAETYEISATAEEELEGYDSDDKLRHIRHELAAGDVVEEVQNITRVLGVDAWPGLIIMGKTHLYLIDGLYQNPQGDILATVEAPKDAFLIPGVALELESSRLTQKWPYNQLAAQSKRTFLFRDVGLEFYFKDNRTVLIVCATPEARQQILNKIAFVQARSSLESISPGGFRSPLINRMSARVTLALQGRDEVATATRRWQAREISNFAYLSILNQASGRTCNDLTQYPVFPWVLSDYTSPTLDLNSPESFRVLSKPMGALTPARREAASTRYSSLQSIGEEAFNYGTHFSSSMIVCHFLIRLAPFTHHFWRLQGGNWDLPDRLFHSIQRAWESAAEDTRGDVRELIPEMFTCHEFLDNRANLDLGIQGSGERVDNVKLPPWCNDDPYLFIQLHRQALESELVSRGLPSWIDLIWGYKQRDPESFNVFHPLSYEGTIDLDSITDPMERDAAVGIIHNFGQTPRKLFTSPHPSRMMEGVKTLPLGTIYGIEESYDLLCHSYRPVHTIDGPVAQLVIDNIADKIIPCGSYCLNNPDVPHERLEWGFNDHSLRLYSDSRLQYIAESYDPTCAAFVDATTALTGSTDGSVNVWRIHRGGQGARLKCTRQMQAHTQSILCVAVSKAWSIVVSGSSDETNSSLRGVAAVWDLKRGVHVWSVRHATSVTLCAVMESTGNIASCSATSLRLHTLNGHFIAEMEVAQPILALGFHEREYSPMGVLATAVGGEIVLRTWKPKPLASTESNSPRNCNTPGAGIPRWDFVTLRALSLQTEGTSIATRMPRVTSLKFVGESLFHGDEAGRVYSWTLPD